MYGWLWRHLPGTWPVKLVCALALVALVVYALFTWVFPWVEPLLPFNRNTVGLGPASTPWVAVPGLPGTEG